MPLPERIETARLVLRRPSPADVEEIFLGWASDVEATRFMSWPRHESLAETRAFLSFSEAEWQRWPAGPYLIASRATGELVGSCGFAFSEASRADVGYILMPSMWGRGYATEALAGQVEAALRHLDAVTLEAAVHPDNVMSLRVLAKCGFVADASPVPAPFPNLGGDREVAAIRYVRRLERAAGGPTDATS